MHVPPIHHGGSRLWLIAGTGEGPFLATILLNRGWRVCGSVVSREATLAYRPHPRLELRVGSLEGESAVAGVLTAAERAGDPFTWVIDATHPFATRISGTLARACGHRGQPLVRLQRPLLRPGAQTTVLEGLPDLSRHCREDEPLLLAIGARHLGEAVRQSPGARHHCRILPTAGALRQAMAAGLAPQRVACLRPAQEATIERALCERWGIRTVVCRQSGGRNEGHWHEITAALGLRLLLLRRPPEPTGTPCLPLEVLTARVGWPEGPA